MEIREYRTVDRTGWPSGEWDDEPDKVQWPDSATGLPCLAVRHRDFGHLCGYVGVPVGHPLYGQPADRVGHNCNYAAACDEGAEDESICHRPAADEAGDVWWFGFDYAHAWHLMPGMEARMQDFGLGSIDPGRPRIYRTLAYLMRECAELAQELDAATRQEAA